MAPIYDRFEMSGARSGSDWIGDYNYGWSDSFSLDLTDTGIDTVTFTDAAAQSFVWNASPSGTAGGHFDVNHQIRGYVGPTYTLLHNRQTSISFSLDQVTFQPVPEPSPGLMVALGLAGLALRKRGRRAAHSAGSSPSRRNR